MRIKAAVVRDRQTLPCIEDLDISGPGAGEVLVKVVATGICHTDLKFAGHDGPMPKPIAPCIR